MEIVLIAVVVIVLIFVLAIVVDDLKRANYYPPPDTGPPPPVKRGWVYQDDRGRDRCYICDKVIFYSEDAAATAADKAMTRRNKYLRPYFEDKCKYWHLSSRKPRVYV